MTDLPVDDVGAFVGAPSLLAPGAPDGPLAGTTFAVKDLFDVAGTTTGAGNPTFAAGRPAATATAPAVLRLLAAGSTLVGKTVTDELAYSLAGRNVHHGTPVNSAAPGHAPGGSSSGSAAAVSAGLVDLAVGTDTGGSIRVPASYGGLWGWRPTHGAVPLEGVVPLAPSFDTVGLLARGPAELRAGARALLGGATVPGGREIRHGRVPGEARADLPEPLADQLDAVAHRLGAAPVALDVDLDESAEAFRILQGAEAWAAHGAWITAAGPAFGADIAARFAAASRITADEVSAASRVRDRVRAAVLAATADGAVLLQVAAAGGAPALDADPDEVDRQRVRTLRQTCWAGLAGCPVVVVPVLRDGHLPLGLACVGAPGTDLALLAWAAATVGA